MDMIIGLLHMCDWWCRRRKRKRKTYGLWLEPLDEDAVKEGNDRLD